MGQSGALYATMGVQAASSITGALSNSSALKANGVYQQNVASTNAALANLSASQVRQLADYQVAKRNQQTQQTIGTQRADMGGSGVELGTGTARQIVSNTRTLGALDELTIRNNATRKAFGYQVEAAEDTARGNFARMDANFKSNTTLLTGGLNAIGGPTATWANYLALSRRAGVPAGASNSDIDWLNG